MKKTKPYDLHNGLGYRLTLAARINQQGFERLLAEIDITRQMWCVLVAVGNMNISLPTEIAKYIGINRTSASRSLRQMAQKGLVERLSKSGDGRTNPITLTDKGRETLEASIPMIHNAQDNLRRRLSLEEQDQLSDLLVKLTQGDTPPVAGI